MTKMFRSRGFRYNKETEQLTMKIYYEAEKKIIDNIKLLNKVSDQLDFFEYSVKDDDSVDSVNFHTGCKKNFEDNISIPDDTLINKINEIFDSSYKAYTIGYRIKRESIFAKSIYYYPTIWKETRYGIKGITDKAIISSYTQRFIKSIPLGKEAKDEVEKYLLFLNKFKGCSITFSYDGKCNYKLYGRILKSKIYMYFNNLIDLANLEMSYGNTVLTAIRISDGRIKGYNFYYLA